MGNKLSCYGRRCVARAPKMVSIGLRSELQARKENRSMYSEDERQEMIRRLEENNKKYGLESKAKLYGLPDEIWEEILSLLTDPKDIWNMWEVHPKFRLLTGESPTNEVLLSQVLSIEKLPHLWKDGRTRFANLKIFRQVSKRMQTTVDRLIEDNFMSALHTPRIVSDNDCIRLRGREKLNRLHRAFCEGPVESRAKRVITRSLCLQLYVDYEDLEWLMPGCFSFRSSFVEFKNKVTSLLEACGEQIWYFRYVLHCYRIPLSIMSVHQGFMDLIQWVSLMPNLKRLELSFWDLPSNEGYLSYPLFPHLPQLEWIVINQISEGSLSQRFLSSVIFLNSHIKYLKLNGVDEESKADILLLLERKPLLSISTFYLLELFWEFPINMLE